jgi:hypothetical protein
MNIANNNAGISMPAPRELWGKSHGNLSVIAYTELHFRTIDLVIVSTVVLASGTTALEGFFRVYESRTFGLNSQEQASSFCNYGDAEEGMRRAISQHALMIQQPTDACADRGNT